MGLFFSKHDWKAIKQTHGLNKHHKKEMTRKVRSGANALKKALTPNFRPPRGRGG